MTAETSFITKTIIGIIVGLLISTGVLPAESKDAFSSDAATVAGYIITILSTAYMLEHALVKLKGDLTPPKTTTQTTTVTTNPQASVPLVESITTQPEASSL